MGLNQFAVGGLSISKEFRYFNGSLAASVCEKSPDPSRTGAVK